MAMGPGLDRDDRNTYDEAGRDIILRSSGDTSEYAPMNEIYRDPVTGGSLWVGNESGCRNERILVSCGISVVVDCREAPRSDPFAETPAISYSNFVISNHWQGCRELEMSEGLSPPQAAARFVEPLCDLVSRRIREGKGVVVHCLAGAHRAGTAGVLLLMHLRDMDLCEALPLAQSLRPAINPICTLADLLRKLQQAREERRLEG